MRVRLRRVGNSMTVTIPCEVVEELMLVEGSEVDIAVREDRVVIEPVAGTWDAMCERLRRDAARRGVTEKDADTAVEELRYGQRPE